MRCKVPSLPPPSPGPDIPPPPPRSELPESDNKETLVVRLVTLCPGSGAADTAGKCWQLMEESFHNFELPAAAGGAVVTLVTSPALSEHTIIHLFSIQFPVFSLHSPLQFLAPMHCSTAALQHDARTWSKVAARVQDIENKSVFFATLFMHPPSLLSSFLCYIKNLKITLNPLI